MSKSKAARQRRMGTVKPPILVVTSPSLSITSPDHDVVGSSVEISSLGLPEDSLSVGLSSVESRSCHDLRTDDSNGTNSLLDIPPTTKSTSLPKQFRGRRLSPNQPQGGAVFLHHRRKQKSFDISMLSRDGEELDYLSRGRSPSPTQDGRTSPNCKADFCEYVVEEILLTELQYVRDLADIVEDYLEFSRKSVHIAEQDITEIYSNIEAIYSFHISFLKDLQACNEEPVAIAESFINRGMEFQIYAEYVTNYPDSIICLSRLLRKPVVNDAYRTRQLILGHGLPLGSYLHKPVQRILKYHLLLQNLLKHFPEDSVGRETITAAIQCMTDCAHDINELKRSHEHAMRIQEIQSILYNFEGYHLLDFGKLILEGDLRMHGAKSFRHIYLFEKGLIICKKMEDGAMSCRTAIMCHNLMLIESIPREPLSFHLVPYDNPRQQNTFQAKTLDQKRQWCSQVKKYILESYESKIPEKAKELLLTLTGKSESDEKFSKPHFKAFTLKSHQTPDYIEKKRRKSQPFISSSAGGTLPRTKKRAVSTVGLPRALFAADSSSIAPLFSKHHSLSALNMPSQPVAQVQRSYDENSDRARRLQKLLDERNGLEDPSWSPEVASMARRYRAPLIKRTHSYSMAVLSTPSMELEDPVDIVPTTPTLKPSIIKSYRSSTTSINSESSFGDDIPNRETIVNHHSDSEVLPKAKTETSLLLNKLSQLKERTSSKLTDLLKRSPPKLSKDFDIHSDHAHDIHTGQSIVGRRLSHSDTMLSLDQPLFCYGAGDSISSNLSPTCEQISSENSLTTLVMDCNEQQEQEKDNPVRCSCDVVVEGCVCVWATPALPPKLRNHSSQRNNHRDSTISLASTNGGTLERSTNSKQGYSTDNLADVEENDYVNVDYGDNVTLQVHIDNEPIYDTVPSLNYIDVSTRCDTITDEKDEVPPELPPLPDFLLKKRLGKTRSASDSSSQDVKAHVERNRLSLPNNVKLNKPASEFWIALQKYMDTGIVDNPMTKRSHRPLRHSEGSVKLSVLEDAKSTDSQCSLARDELAAGHTQSTLPVSGSNLSPEYGQKVFKLARRYSGRIKGRKAGEVRKSRASKIDGEEDSSTTSTSDGNLEPLTSKPRRVNSVRLRRTNSSRIKRFQVILDSDDECCGECKADSGAQQCDIDSGSDCNDIYEKQSMAALESFASDDEMRDSAIYSEGEESGVISSVIQRLHQNGSSVIDQRARTLSPEKQMGPSTDHGHEDDIDQYILSPPQDNELVRKSRSLPRSQSLPCHTTADVIISSVEDIISWPVSSNLLIRLEALQRSSTFEKETSSENDKLLASKETSVQQRTQILQQHSSRTFSKTVNVPNHDCQSVTEIQKQLVSKTKRLSKQQSTEQLVIGLGLVKQVKEKLHVN